MLPKRLLIVDDEAALLNLLRRFFERRGFEVDTAADPTQAIEAMRSASVPYALVVTDLMFGSGDESASQAELNGEDLIEQLRGLQPNLPALLASGYPYRPRLPDVQFVQKPVLPQALLDLIEQTIGPIGEVSA
ncbi:MAG: response regulator [Acidobacteriota bacterium]